MESVSINKIDIIKSLHQKVNDKNHFYKAVADEFGLQTSSVRINWFFRFEITDKYKVQDNLIAFMNKYIENN